jgi:hypothetical protein
MVLFKYLLKEISEEIEVLKAFIFVAFVTNFYTFTNASVKESRYLIHNFKSASTSNTSFYSHKCWVAWNAKFAQHDFLTVSFT